MIEPGTDQDTTDVAEPPHRGEFNSDEARYDGAVEENLAPRPPGDDDTSTAQADPRLAPYDGGYGGQEFGVEAGTDGSAGT